MNLPSELMQVFLAATLEYRFEDWSLTGSRAICPEQWNSESDWDVIVLVNELPESAVPYAGQRHDESVFRSTKYTAEEGTLNLLFTNCEQFFDDFVLATKVAKELKLSKKSDRVTLFQAILYKDEPKEPEEVTAQ